MNSINPVICYLTKSEDKTVKQLIASLRLLDKNFKFPNRNIPKVIFHEKDFNHEYKKRIDDLFKVQFVEIELKPSVTPTPSFDDGLNYAIGYRNMCQFFHSEFYKYLDEDYDWIMRLDTDSFIIDKVECDPFQFLSQNNKIYGYVAELPEWPPVVKHLGPWFQTLADELDLKTELFQKIIKDGNYGMRQIYNNFEIIHRSYFKNLKVDYITDRINKSGNIYRWRWGDAPLRTLILSMCYREEQLHRFSDIGYHHVYFHQKDGKRRTSLGGDMMEMFYEWDKNNNWLLK